MPFEVICPNRNDPAFKRLMADIGEAGAYLAFFRNGNKIPFTAEAEKLLGIAAEPGGTKPLSESKPAEPQAKEPWQMTKTIFNDLHPDEENGFKYVAVHDSTDKLIGIGLQGPDVRIGYDSMGRPIIGTKIIPSTKYSDWLPRGADESRKEFLTPPRHRDFIEIALHAGKPVPPEVLADYPDLKPKEPLSEGKKKRPEKGLPETATESDLISDMSSSGRKFLDEVKKTKDEFTGLDATKLSEADRRNLARLGVSFVVDRKNRIVGSWPASKRVEALRQKVTSQQSTPPPSPAKAVEKSPTETLNTAAAVKLTVPYGTTQIRLTDKNGKKSVQPLGNFQKGANPARGADIVKIEAGRIGLQKQFIPMDEPVGVEERKKQASLKGDTVLTIPDYDPESPEKYPGDIQPGEYNEQQLARMIFNQRDNPDALHFIADMLEAGDKGAIDHFVGLLRQASHDRNAMNAIIKELTPYIAQGQGSIGAPRTPTTPSAPLTAQSISQLREILPQSGLPQETQQLINAFLDSPLAPVLSGFNVTIADALEGNWQGVTDFANSLIGIARNADPKTAPHEFAHAVWSMLPKEVQDQFERMRIESLDDTLRKPLNYALIGQLEKLRTNPTSGGEQFVQLGYDRSIYHLSSAEEFFTHSFSDKFTGENLNPEQRTIWQQIRDLFRSIIAAIKKFFRLPQSQDELLTNIMAGRYEVTPEGSTPREAQASLPKETTQVMGEEKEIGGREHMDEKTLQESIAVAKRVLSESGINAELVDVPDDRPRRGPRKLWQFDTAFDLNVEGQKLVGLLKQELATQRQPGKSAEYLANLITSINWNFETGRLTGVMDINTRRQLQMLTLSETSERGSMLGALSRHSPELKSVAHDPELHLQRMYAQAYGGDAYDSLFLTVIKHFKDLFTDDELAKVQKDNPQLANAINIIISGWENQAGNRVYKAVQRKLNPKNVSLKQMEKNALFQEEVAWVLEVLQKAGIKEPPAGPKMTALEKLRLMVTDKNQDKINAAIEAAIATGEIEAGKQAARNATMGDKGLLADLEGRYADGEKPTKEEIEAGLQLANFSKWKRMRDNWTGYDPVTVRLARQVAADNFKGLRFGTPKAKPLDTRISIQELAKQSDAEISRVLDAYAQNIEANIAMAGVSDATRLAVRQVIVSQLLDQINNVVRPKVRDAMFAEKKAGKPGVTPDQKLQQLLNSRLFSDDRITQLDELNKLAAKSAIQRLLPNMGAIVKQVLATPRIYQGNMTKEFVDQFVSRYADIFELDDSSSQVAGLRQALTVAFSGRLKEAQQKAFDSAFKELTPEQQAVMPKTDKKLWTVIDRLKNAGIFDSAEALKRIAELNGYKIPTPEAIAGIKRTAERMEELESLTPAKRSRIQNDPLLTADEKTKQLKTETDIVQAANKSEISQLQIKLAAQWSAMQKPMTLNPLEVLPPFAWLRPTEAGRNTSFAVFQFAMANILAKVGFPIRLFGHIENQFIYQLMVRPPAVIWQVFETIKSKGGKIDTAEVTHNVVRNTISQWKNSIMPALRAARAQFLGRGEQRNIEGLMDGVNALERAAQESEKLYKEGKKSQAALVGLLSLFRFPLRVVGALDAFQGEQVEFQEIRNQALVELAKSGISGLEAKLKLEQAFGNLKEEWASALDEARDIFAQYETMKHMPDGAFWDGVRQKFDAGHREHAVREAADYILKAKAYQKMDAMGLPADSIKARVFRQRMGQAWQVVPGKGSIGYALYKSAQAWNEFAVSHNMPFLSAYFARAIANGVNYFGRYTPTYLMFTGKVDKLTGVGTDPSNETPLDRKTNLVRAILGTMLGALIAWLIYEKRMRVYTAAPMNKSEREKFIAEGHKAGTIEWVNDDGTFVPFSLTVGPFAAISTYAVAAGKVRDLADQRIKQQAEADKKALAAGLQPTPIPHDWVADSLAVAGRAAWQTIMGGSTVSGLTSSYSEFGVPNAKKSVAATISPLVPGLPGYQEISRAMGVALDKNLATVFDYMVPLPTSGARMLNSLGEPVKTPNDIQRVIQAMTAGTYPFPVDPKSVQDSTQAYGALYASGYTPPAINPNKGYAINGQFRPMNSSELERYTQARGEYFKANLLGLGSNPTPEAVKAAFQEANNRALNSVGAAAATRGRSLPTRPAIRGAAQAQRTGQPRLGGGLIRGSLKMRGLPRMRGLRTRMAGMTRPAKVSGAPRTSVSRGSSLRRQKRRVRLV